MKNNRINWSSITNESRRSELKKAAAKMKRRGYSVALVSYDGKFSVEGSTVTGGKWIA